MNYDPNLKQAMTEIEKICQKYDCGGYFSLCSKGFGEFRWVFPEWQGVKYELSPEGEPHITLRVKKSLGHTLEFANLTAHFIHGVRDMCGLGFQIANNLCKESSKVWNTEHTPFHNFRPHRGDEN